MKKTILILLCFCFIATAAYAGWATLRGSNEVELGTEANPVYITLIS